MDGLFPPTPDTSSSATQYLQSLGALIDLAVTEIARGALEIWKLVFFFFSLK